MWASAPLVIYLFHEHCQLRQPGCFKTGGRVGVFGIGLAAYWEQFPGLKTRLEGYQQVVEDQMRALGVDVISAGLVDTAPAAAELGRGSLAPGST